MRRAGLLALCMVLVLASGCDFVTRQAAPPAATLPVPTPTPQSSPVPSPSRPPATGALDLGVSPADTYGVRGTALDSRRGLLYIVAEDGDASVGQGVLTVVDLPNRQVRASVPVPLPFTETPTVVLSTDGKRLYVAAPDAATLYVIQTDPSSLGTTLRSAPDVVAAALGSVTERLYVIGASGLRGLNAVTLHQEQYTALPDPAAGAYVRWRWLAVNEQAGLLYVTYPGAEVIAVYRLEDLGAPAAIAPGGHLNSLLCAPERETAYALMEYYTALGPATRIVPLRGERVSGQSWVAEPGWVITEIAWDRDTRRLLSLEDSTGSDASQSRLRVLDPDTGQTLEKIAIPYLDWAEPGRPAPFTYSGHLYSAGETLIAADVRTGVVQRIPLGIALLSAALDEATNHLFVADSTGAIRVVDPFSLQTVADWPGTLEVGPGGVSQVPLTASSGRLYVADYSAGCTWVLDAISGAHLGSIPKAGQISVDVKHNRVFVTQDGVYLADGSTYQITGAIQETVRQDPLQIGSIGAIQAQYDPQHDLLFVTISNNLPGSSSNTWLQVYEGTTLGRVEGPFKTQARFVESLALSNRPDRLWVASLVPGAELAAFTLDGTRQIHLQGLGGPLFPSWLGQHLYVADWEGWVTVDAASGDVIAYNRTNLTGASFAVLDARHARLYANLSTDADLLAIDPLAPIPPRTEDVDALPLQPTQHLAVGDDGTLLAVNGSEWGPVTQGAIVGIRRPDGRGWWQIWGGLPARVWPIVKAAPGSPGVFFAFSAESAQPYGLFRSTDNGRTWHSAMSGLTDLRIVDFAFSPNFATDQTALLLAGDSGLFQTRDGGETWTHPSSLAGYRVGAAITSSGALRVLVLAADLDNPALTTVYTAMDPMEKIERLGALAVGPGVRMSAFATSPNWSNDGTALSGYPLKLSQDEGYSWRPVGPEPAGSLLACSILFSPRFGSDRTVYALVIESLYGGSLQRSLLRSTDGGEIWERAVEFVPALLSALTIAPDGQLWAGDSQGTVAVLNPASLTWQPVPIPTPVPPSPVPPTPAPTPEE